MIVEYCDNGLANDYMNGSNIINQSGLIQNPAFESIQQTEYFLNERIKNVRDFSIKDFDQVTAIKIKSLPEITILSDKVITGQHDKKFVLKDSATSITSTSSSPKKYFNILYYPDIQKNTDILAENDLNFSILKTKKNLDSLNLREWPEDMKPSEETVGRAQSLWIAIQDSISKIGIGNPNVSAADENSIDLFWGNKKSRILINIPSLLDEMLFLHFITPDGQTVMNFTDAHANNIIGVLKNLRYVLD